MNNNYHTQIDKQTNILNEIAANNNLLQQQMQNFPGTPINKNPTQPMQQLTPQQIMYAQMMQQQNQKTVPQGPVNFQYPTAQPGTDDEIELSDAKPELKQEDIPINLNKQNDNPDQQQINKQIQQVFQTNPGPNNLQAKLDKGQLAQKKLPMLPPPAQFPPFPPFPPTGYPAQVPQQSKLSEYVIIPIILLITFMAIMHPKTSKIFDKFLPDPKSTKGLLVRGVILVIVYLIAKFATNMTSK